MYGILCAAALTDVFLFSYDFQSPNNQSFVIVRLQMINLSINKFLVLSMV